MANVYYEKDCNFEILKSKAELAKKSLEVRAKRLANTKSDVAPIRISRLYI